MYFSTLWLYPRLFISALLAFYVTGKNSSVSCGTGSVIDFLTVLRSSECETGTVMCYRICYLTALFSTCTFPSAFVLCLIMSRSSPHLSPDPIGGVTFHSQDKLPKLPIPDLKETTTKYLAALEALQVRHRNTCFDKKSVMIF
jgi:hypothetical protein